jgi:hypothetical protein
VLRLLVVGSDDLLQAQASGRRFVRERRGARGVGGRRHHPSRVVDDLGHGLVGDVDQHRRQVIRAGQGQDIGDPAAGETVGAGGEAVPEHGVEGQRAADQQHRGDHGDEECRAQPEAHSATVRVEAVTHQAHGLQ